MKNNIVLGICGFDKGFDMVVLSKLHASLHRVSFARLAWPNAHITIQLSKQSRIFHVRC